MRVLLDTHALLWWLLSDPRMSDAVAARLADPETEIVISAVNGWEIATKVRIGKLVVPEGLARQLSSFVATNDWQELPISIEHAQLSGHLDGTHRDPFDRMLAAQSLVEKMPIATNDAAITAFEAEVVW